MSGMDHEQAWDAIHDGLPPGWRVTAPSFDPATHLWTVTARSPNRGGRRAPPPDYVIGEGPDELAALQALVRRLEDSS